MRIEDIDGRTRPADPRTHEGYQISSRDAPLPWGSGMLITLIGLYPDNRGSVPRHSTHSGCEHERAYEQMSA